MLGRPGDVLALGHIPWSIALASLGTCRNETNGRGRPGKVCSALERGLKSAMEGF